MGRAASVMRIGLIFISFVPAAATWATGEAPTAGSQRPDAVAAATPAAGVISSLGESARDREAAARAAAAQAAAAAASRRDPFHGAGEPRPGNGNGNGARPPRSVPELDPSAAGAVAMLLAGGGLLIARRRRRD